jgi:hypothetical protein
MSKVKFPVEISHGLLNLFTKQKVLEFTQMSNVNNPKLSTIWGYRYSVQIQDTLIIIYNAIRTLDWLGLLGAELFQVSLKGGIH